MVAESALVLANLYRFKHQKIIHQPTQKPVIANNKLKIVPKAKATYSFKPSASVVNTIKNNFVPQTPLLFRTNSNDKPLVSTGLEGDDEGFNTKTNSKKVLNII